MGSTNAARHVEGALEPGPEKLEDGRRSGRLRVVTVPVGKLDDLTRARMWALFSRYYESVDRAHFEKDLSGKDRVLLVRDTGDQSLQGFTTVQCFDGPSGSTPYRVVFSGDTVLEKAYWGRDTLQRAFAVLLMKEKLLHPHRRVYWFLISKGYKTYLLLSRNFLEFWPRRGVDTPAREAQMLNELARQKFPEAWKPEKGVLQFPTCPGRLRTGVAPIDAKLLEHPDIRFFSEKNPGHAQGDELCCLGLVDLAFGLAMLGKYG